MAIRIVIDTNVFVSALIAQDSASRELLRRCLRRDYQPLMGNALLCEYESIICRDEVMARCALKKEEISRLFEALMSVSEWVSVFYLWRPNLRDEADNHLIELAVAGNASFLVTNNTKDFQGANLLFPSLSILKPEEMIGS